MTRIYRITRVATSLVLALVGASIFATPSTAAPTKSIIIPIAQPQSRLAALIGCDYWEDYGRPAGDLNGRLTVNCHMSRTFASNAGGVLAFQRSYNLCYRWKSPLFYFHPNIAEDGSFGPGTEAALKRVQQYEGLVADGAYGPLTAQKFEIWSSSRNSCYSIS